MRKTKSNKTGRIVITILIIAIAFVAFKFLFYRDSIRLSKVYGVDFPRGAREVRSLSIEVNDNEINYYKYKFRNLRDAENMLHFSSTNKIPDIYYTYAKHANVKEKKLPDVENTVYWNSRKDGNEVWVLLNKEKKEMYIFEEKAPN